MKKDLKLEAVNTDETEGQLVMEGLPEPVEQPGEPVEVVTPTPTPEPQVTVTPVKPAGKPVASDKTVIKNLRAEVRKITEELNALHAELDIQEQKNIILFNQMKEMRSLEVELESKQGMAQEILYNGITNTLNAFNAILRK